MDSSKQNCSSITEESESLGEVIDEVDEENSPIRKSISNSLQSLLRQSSEKELKAG